MSSLETLVLFWRKAFLLWEGVISVVEIQILLHFKNRSTSSLSNGKKWHPDSHTVLSLCSVHSPSAVSLSVSASISISISVSLGLSRSLSLSLSLFFNSASELYRFGTKYRFSNECVVYSWSMLNPVFWNHFLSV